MFMGASSSSEQDSSLSQLSEQTLGHLTENLHFELEEDTGALRVHLDDSSQASGRTVIINRVSGRQAGEREGEMEEGENEREVLPRSEEMVESDAEEEEEEEEEEAESRLSTLRLLARLFGGRNAVP